MALLNFAGIGTYSVAAVDYDKNSASVNIKLTTYKDRIKNEALFSVNVSCTVSRNDVKIVRGVITAPVPAAQRVDGASWLISKTVDTKLYPEFVNFSEGDVVCTWQQELNSWSYDRLNTGELVKLGDGLVKRVKNAELVDAPDYVSQEEFNKWFGMTAISGSSNILRQAYLYMISLPMFAHCVSDTR